MYDMILWLLLYDTISLLVYVRYDLEAVLVRYDLLTEDLYDIHLRATHTTIVRGLI